MPMTPKEMIKYLKKNGFEEIRQNGSHIKKGLRAGNTKISRAEMSPAPETNGGIMYGKIILSGYFS